MSDWITLQEAATRVNRNLKTIATRATRGDFGPIATEAGEPNPQRARRVFWPLVAAAYGLAPAPPDPPRAVTLRVSGEEWAVLQAHLAEGHPQRDLADVGLLLLTPDLIRRIQATNLQPDWDTAALEMIYAQLAER